MGMSNDEAIEIINHYLDYPKEEVRKALLLAINTMRKYQMEEQNMIPEFRQTECKFCKKQITYIYAPNNKLFDKPLLCTKCGKEFWNKALKIFN